MYRLSPDHERGVYLATDAPDRRVCRYHQSVKQRHFVVGHRILGGSRVKRCNSTLAALPGDHLSLTRAPGSKFWGIPPDARLTVEFPPRLRTLTTTTAAVTTRASTISP